MTRIHNIPLLKQRRKSLRRNLTPAEARMWTFLQRSQIGGRKFRRQHSIGPYVVDFYCPAERLAIELDGAAHDSDTAQIRDLARTRFLESARIRVLRFENRHVFENIEGVIAEIERELNIKE